MGARDEEPSDGEPSWEHVPPILREFAEVDLLCVGEVTPCLAAYADEDLRYFGFLRAFARGDHHGAIREMLDTAMVLGADRLCLSMGARIWSLDDPIPPVVEGVGDLRQRVVMLHQVDASVRGRGEVRCEAWPYDLEDGVVRWRERFAPPGPVESWVNRALAAAVLGRARSASASQEIGKLIADRVAVGHRFVLGTSALRMLGLRESSFVPDDR